MRRIYLDTDVLVCCYSEVESNQSQKQAVIKAFDIFSKLKDIQLCTSSWTITEMVKVLTLKIGIDPLRVAEIEADLTNEARLHGMKIYFIDVSPRKDYDFREFFYNIRQGILKYNSGVPDTIHGVIMRNNDIENILTFNVKDFEKVPGVTAIDPKDVKINKD